MAKKAKGGDFAVLDKICKPGACLDDLPPPVDWSADKDMFARLDDRSIVDEIFAYDWSALDVTGPPSTRCSPMIGPVLDEMFGLISAHYARARARGDGSSFHRAPAAIGLRRRVGDRSQPVEGRKIVILKGHCD